MHIIVFLYLYQQLSIHFWRFLLYLNKKHNSLIIFSNQTDFFCVQTFIWTTAPHLHIGMHTVHTPVCLNYRVSRCCCDLLNSFFKLFFIKYAHGGGGRIYASSFYPPHRHPKKVFFFKLSIGFSLVFPFLSNTFATSWQQTNIINYDFTTTTITIKITTIYYKLDLHLCKQTFNLKLKIEWEYKRETRVKREKIILLWRSSLWWLMWWWCWCYWVEPNRVEIKVLTKVERKRVFLYFFFVLHK